MGKSDANIKIGADTTAFTTQMAGLEKGITAKMAKIGNVFMGALGLKAAAQNIAGAFSAFTKPAAELENVATSLGVVMGNAEPAGAECYDDAGEARGDAGGFAGDGCEV